MDDVRLTPVEAEVMREQGKWIGPTVEDRPVRQMTSGELFGLLASLLEESGQTQDKARMNWLERQIGKVRREMARRAGW